MVYAVKGNKCSEYNTNDRFSKFTLVRSKSSLTKKIDDNGKSFFVFMPSDMKFQKSGLVIVAAAGALAVFSEFLTPFFGVVLAVSGISTLREVFSRSSDGSYTRMMRPLFLTSNNRK